MNYPWLDARDIEAKAHDLRGKALSSEQNGRACIDLDVLVFDYLCEYEMLSFDDEHELGLKDGEKILGRTTPIPGKIEITASIKTPSDFGRYRFTLAHEIGHWVLHRPLFLAAAESLDLFDVKPDDTTLTSLHRSIFPDGSRRVPPPEEWQANRFAIALLIDSDTLREQFMQRFGAPVVAFKSDPWSGRSRSLREHSRFLASYQSGKYDSLCSVFGLSAEAMAIALEQRGYSVDEMPMI